MGCGASRPTANKYADTSSEAVPDGAFRSPVGKENSPPRRTKDNEESRDPGESLDNCDPQAFTAAAALESAVAVRTVRVGGRVLRDIHTHT